MGRLKELLSELCPDGVEWKPLGAVAKKETAKNKGELCKLAYSITQSGLMPTDEFFKDAKVTSKNTSDYRLVKPGWFVYSPSRVDVGSIDYHCGKETVIVSPIDVVFSADNSVILNDFLMAYLKSHQGWWHTTLLLEGIPGTGRKGLPFERFAEMLIPVPPIEAQREVVRILDSFQALDDKLTAELEMREKQFHAYLDTVFKSVSNPIECTIGDLFDIRNGLNKGKEFFGSGNPIVNFTDVFNNYKLDSAILKGKVVVDDNELQRFSVHRGDVFFTRTSETKDEIGMSAAMVEEIPNCVFSGFVLRARPKTDLLLPEFCGYYFSSHAMRKEIIRTSHMTTRALTNGSLLSEICVSFPKSLEVQREIVAKLDAMQALIDSIRRERDLRRKQFAYYRDRILDFPRKEV